MMKGNVVRGARRNPDGTVSTGGLPEAFPEWGDDERWLVITPHDDDPALAGSMALAAAADRGVSIRVRIVTDGSMGYTTAVSAADVVERRREETRASFHLLGIEDVAWFNYPDARVHRWQGRFPLNIHTPEALHRVGGYTGVQNSITAELREFRPTRLVVLSAEDYHPDHKIVHQEVLISLFHAQGDIWPELGPPLAHMPWVHELAAYCPFAEDPDIQIVGDTALFERKLAAIAAFASQKQIERLVEAVRAAGPVEYVRSFRFSTYSPSAYASLFPAIPEGSSP